MTQVTGSSSGDLFFTLHFSQLNGEETKLECRGLPKEGVYERGWVCEVQKEGSSDIVKILLSLHIAKKNTKTEC